MSVINGFQWFYRFPSFYISLRLETRLDSKRSYCVRDNVSR